MVLNCRMSQYKINKCSIWNSAYCHCALETTLLNVSKKHFWGIYKDLGILQVLLYSCTSWLNIQVSYAILFFSRKNSDLVVNFLYLLALFNLQTFQTLPQIHKSVFVIEPTQCYFPPPLFFPSSSKVERRSYSINLKFLIICMCVVSNYSILAAAEQ